MNLRTLACSLSLLALAVAPAIAQGHKAGAGHSHSSAEGHGGAVTMTKAHHFEVVFHRDSVRVYMYDSDQKPVSPKGVIGDVSLRFRKGRKTLKAKLALPKPKAHGADGHGQHAPDYLQASLNLAGVPEKGAKASFKLSNLPQKGEKTASFTETFKLARLVRYECPMKCEKAKDKPGRCGKCGMALKKGKFIYACSMHPQVTSRKSGDTCSICNMTLTQTTDSPKGKANDHGGHGKHGR